MHVKSQNGVTLPEVLISLLIFALIASASVYALRLGVDSREQLSAADDQLKKLQIARILIKQDLAQVVARPARDEFGGLSPVYFSGGQTSFASRVEDDEKILISFTRGGWLNARAATPRSALQYVDYIFKGGAVIRRARIYIDETPNAEYVERVLFDGLSDASAKFLIGEFRGELDWADAWPISGSGQRPPRAVALVLEENGTETLRQLFWIGELGA